MRSSDAINLLQTLCPDSDPTSEEQLTKAKSFLSKLRPLQVLTLLYSRRLDDQRPLVAWALRSRFGSKKDLLKWVFEDPRLFQDLTYVRLPSLAKRVLVSRLVGYASHRYPWITHRLIHTFAFRPDYFLHSRARSSHFGPLYRKAKVPKGHGGSRTLWLPNPALKRVQRCLLVLSLNRALAELPRCVNGCRPRHDGDPPYGIYRNASAHLGQEFVASFDIADFFPSISIAQIVPALLSVKASMVITRPNDRAPQGEFFPWRHDAAVLVARLATHRGRLPQGAPTSPALANLVFRSVDERIISRLGSDFVYTRYVDDVTISVSKSSARRHQIGSRTQMLQRVEKVVRESLNGTPFRLNSRKTTVSQLRSTHVITGLKVTSDTVELRRKTKRQIRSLLYRIQKYGFVETACELTGGEVQAQTTCRRPVRAQRLVDGSVQRVPPDHIRSGRRLSTERLAVLILKRIHPDLRIEIPDVVRDYDGVRIKHRGMLHEGKRAWQDVERILPALWEDSLQVEDENGHTNVRRPDGEILCRIRSERYLAFFHLAKREAIATTELWHHLQGFASGMAVEDSDRCFNSINAMRSAIVGTLANVRIKIPAGREAGQGAALVPAEQIALTPEDDVANLARQLLEIAQDIHIPICNRPPDADWIRQSLVFRRPCKSRQDLQKWLFAADLLFNRTFPRLPNARDKPKSLASTVFHQIRILSERLNNMRLPVYQLEQRCLGKARIRTRQIDAIDQVDAVRVQQVVLGHLQEILGPAAMNRTRVGRDEQWLGTLVENDLQLDHSQRLHKAVERFIDLREHAVWPNDGTLVFSTDINAHLPNLASSLAEPIAEGQWKTVWNNLFEAGKTLQVVTIESAVAKDSTKLPQQFYDVLAEDKRDFNVLRCLRHRAAHGVSLAGLSQEIQERIHREWVTVQNWSKQHLGRNWSWNAKPGPRQVFFDEERDLKITPLEGTIIKLELLLATNRVLGKFKQRAKHPS